MNMFIKSVYLSLALSAGWMYIIYKFQDLLFSINIPGIYWILLILNTYQVLTHVLTALKFIGVADIFIPGGAKDDQQLYEFTIHNVLDLLGWILIFIYTKKLYLLYVFTAAVHIGVGQVAILLYDTFQEYYIKDISKNHTTFQYTKLIFVILDFVFRSYALYNILLYS